MRLDEASFTIFDVETTGLYPSYGDKICEIGAVRVGPDAKKNKTFHSLVDPQTPISPGAFYVNKITPAMLKGKPVISKVLPDFLKFTEGSVLVAYNAGFDLGFLASALAKEDDILERYDVIDALALARRLFPGLGRYNLASVAQSLGIDTAGGHRAMADALITLGIFRKELDMLIGQGVKDVSDVLMLQGKAHAYPKEAVDGMIKLFEEAIRDQKKVAITYLSSWDNRRTKRVVSPLEIRRSYNRSYLVAHCHLREEERNFRIDSVLEAVFC